ncbi:MAG: Hsp20/alpha crystallin family protein [Bacillota bacterium]|nr:Hsp20/alpha crystallin family protein [Bacillota bacterium]
MIMRWDPFAELESLREEMNRLFEDFWWRGRREALPAPERREVAPRVWQPSVDMYETDDAVVIKANLPGIDQKDIDITVDPDSVTIKGEVQHDREVEKHNYYRRERSYGSFMRRLPLAVEVKPEESKATFKNGVLEITIPKASPGKSKSVKVKIQ